MNLSKFSIGGDKPDLSRDWIWLAVASTLVYLFAVGVKLMELPLWEHPALRVAGEYLLGTHDAYFWVAGAKGVGLAQGTPMALAAALYEQITGASPGLFAFFAPAFIPSLVGVVALWWGWILGGRESGILAGFLGGLAPGFFYRTRLGYYDTDMITLLFPMAVGWLLAYWLMPGLRRAWFDRAEPRAEGERGPEDRGLADAALIVAAGALARFGGWWHQDVINYAFLAFFLALALIFFAGRPGWRVRNVWGLAVFGLAAFAGSPGLVAAVFLAAALALRPEFIRPWTGKLWLALAFMALAAVIGAVVLDPVHAVWYKAVGYLKPVAETRDAGGPVYPAIAQSIREAQNLQWEVVLNRLAPSSWLAVVGLAGFIVLCVFRTWALLLLPLVVLTLLAAHMGARMSMFGAPCVFLGIGVWLNWLGGRVFQGRTWKGWALAGVQLILAIGLFLPWFTAYQKVLPTPVLNSIHAKALLALGNKARADSEVWTWWDYGYATQYYARLMTPSDGGRHTGSEIFPTAVALTTPNPLQSAQVIKYCASQDYDPTKVWNEMTGAQVRDFLRSLGEQTVEFGPMTDQYFVITWENLRLAYWITFYGTWDLVGGSGIHSNVASVGRNVRLDEKQGLLVMADGRSLPISSVDLLTPAGRQRMDFDMNKGGPRVVVNQTSGEVFVVDQTTYDSMLLKMLMDREPQKGALGQNFKLVYDAYPNVRIYKVL